MNMRRLHKLLMISLFASVAVTIVIVPVGLLFVTNPNPSLQLPYPLKSILPSSLDDIPVCDSCCYRYQPCVNTTYCNTSFSPLPDDELERRHCKRRLPKAIIFGTKKSGTSALRTFLSYHPDIAAARKEINFFNQENEYSRGLDHYKQMMPLSTKRQITIEKTPNYCFFFHEGVPHRIYKLLPHIKLIIILRDPVKRAISDYFMETRYLLETGQKLSNKSAISYHEYELFETFERSVLTTAGGKVNARSKFVEFSVYARCLTHWLEVFPRSSILAIDGEAFIHDPLPSLHAVERFLGVMSFFDKSSFFTEDNRGFRCLAKPVRICWKSAIRKPHPPIETDVVKKLQNYFRPYNKKLKHLLNQTFTWSDQ